MEQQEDVSLWINRNWFHYGSTGRGFRVEQQEGIHCEQEGVSLWSNRKGFHCKAIGKDFTVEQQEGISL